jgi:hypothetical protein
MPRSQTLDDLIRDKAADLRADSAYYAIDWDERRTWWQGCVDAFLTEIVGWFQTLIDEGVITATRKPIEIREEHIGKYMTESLTLAIDALAFDVIPIETHALGGFGHISLVGTAGHAKLLLCSMDDSLPVLEQRATAEWYFVRSSNDDQLYRMKELTFKQLYTDLMSIGI